MYMKVLSQNDAFKLSDLIKDGDWMVLYYAEWCGHCNAMKPEWEKFVNKMKDPNVNSANIKVADVKSDFIADMKDKPEIPGFPTIKKYSNGKEVADFKDDRIVENMIKFAQSNNKTSNAKESEEAIKETGPVIPTVEHAAPSVPSTEEELPMVPINIDEHVDVPKHSSKHSVRVNTANLIKSRKSNKISIKKINSHNSKGTKKVSAIKKSIKQLKMNNLFEMPKDKDNNKPVIANTPKVQVQVPSENLSCNEIRKAKICKSNPKCMFDYQANKCVDKTANVQQGLPPANKKKTLFSRRTKVKQNSRGSRGSKNNNIKKSTKEVFGELIKSFSRISNEARKDSKLLKKASNKL